MAPSYPWPGPEAAHQLSRQEAFPVICLRGRESLWTRGPYEAHALYPQQPGGPGRARSPGARDPGLEPELGLGTSALAQGVGIPVVVSPAVRMPGPFE